MRLKIIKQIKRRGQVLVFYALLMPLMFLFVGVGLDLGWYYLNVSRLQNAADAAALAGAQTLVKQEEFNNYLVISLAPNKLPADFDDYADVFSNTFGNAAANGKLSHYHKSDEIAEALKAGRAVAEEYTRKNLSDSAEVNPDANTTDTLSTTDGWSISKNDADKKVTGTIELKYKEVDGKNDVYGSLYYVVNLTEKIRHFFLPGWFDDMAAPVRAVVLLKPHYKGLIEPMQHLERTMVIDNWEYTSRYVNTEGAYSGKWNHYQAGRGSNTAYGVRYTSGNAYREETVIVKTTKKTNSNISVTKSSEGSSGVATAANGNQWYSPKEVDSINIDFRAEISNLFSTDWDLGQPLTGATSKTYRFTEGWSITEGADKRILFNAEFDDAFPTRDTSKFADPLWARIESEPIIRQLNSSGNINTVYSSVRQITLNFNADNTGVGTYNGKDYYKQRPYVIFYTGPENIDYTTDKNGVLIRHSQPVVLNLNQDLNAIIYMPESPVVINGNGHKFTGFVIAKCYLQTVTDAEMTDRSAFYLYDGFNAPKLFRGNYTKGTDAGGNTIYFKPEYFITRSELEALYPGAEITDAGIVQETSEVNYLLLKYSRADHNTYATYDADGKLNENKTFAAYVNATYKEKYKTFSGLTDEQITAIHFPDENYNETTATYWVAKGLLLDSDPDPNAAVKNDRYVKVMVGDEAKYINKKYLPYVKIRTNHHYFYTCIYDLKLIYTNYKRVRMIDNSYTDEQMESSYDTVKNKGIKTPTNEYKNVDDNATVTDADIYVNPNDKWCDSWALHADLYNSLGDWKRDKLTFYTENNESTSYTENNVTYFTRKKESTYAPQVIARYHKVTVNGVDMYAKEGDNAYYTKVYNNATNHENYIIVDENGNMLTKSITPPEVLTAKDEDANDALNSKVNAIWSRASDKPLIDYYNTYTREPNEYEQPGDNRPNIVDGKYRGNDLKHLNSDYRIPALERVYLNTTFNLSGESRYSYFAIEDLRRVNYTYMNVNELNHTVNEESSDNWQVEDMFFTTTRAYWID